MPLPTEEMLKVLLGSSRAVREKIHAIARRLEALNEYGPEQALYVAADIVRTRFLGRLARAPQKTLLLEGE